MFLSMEASVKSRGLGDGESKSSGGYGEGERSKD
jgi:hypothetical protein